METGIVLVEMAVAGGDVELAALGHGVAGIGHEVEEARFELAGVDGHRRGAGLEIEVDLHVLAERAGHDLGHALDEAVDVDRRRPQRLAAREGEKPASQLGAAQGGGQRLGRQLVVRRPLLELLAQQVEVADDDAQEVVEVVGEAAGQVADGFHLLRLLELALDGLAAADVANGGDGDEAAVRLLHRERRLDRELGSVAAKAGEILDQRRNRRR